MPHVKATRNSKWIELANHADKGSRRSTKINKQITESKRRTSETLKINEELT
jgi:hypothetical protein